MDSSCVMDSIKRHTGLMTLPKREVSWPSVFDARGGSEQAGDGCGGKAGKAGRESTAVVRSSGTGEVATEGSGRLPG